MKSYFTLLLALCFSFLGIAQENPYVFLQEDKLNYVADDKGNTIPDYSNVGYKLGEEELPDIEISLTLSPSSKIEDDRTQDIQEAINKLGALPIQNNGYRGALLLKAGKYRVDSTLHIHASGIVIKGEGMGDFGTEIFYSSKKQSNLFEVSGMDDIVGIESSRKKVIDAYVPIGSKTITVETGHDFKVGDKVLYIDEKTPAWVDTLGMGSLKEIGKSLGRKKTTNWTAEGYIMKYKRFITAIDGTKITLDAPVMEFMDGIHSKAYIEKYEWKGKIENIGFENFKAVSYYQSDKDENHGWHALEILNSENLWAFNVHAQYFGNGLLRLTNVYKATIQECISSDFKSLVKGGRRYGFTIATSSGGCLITNCISDNGGRHNFATGSRTLGPNVFYNCKVTGATFDDIGPHERWAVGTLWENIETPGVINIQNRGVLGTGHGWTGAQNTFWNCKAGKWMSVNNPPLAYKNWIMGCTSPSINKTARKGAGNVTIADVYSRNKAMPFSLFWEQSKAADKKNYNFTNKNTALHQKGIVQEVLMPDSLWRNKGAITLEFKLNKEALTARQQMIDCPIVKLDLHNNSLWPALKAAPQAKGARKERVQFAFFNPEQWYHLIIIWDGPNKKFRLYLNGEKQQPSYFGEWTTNEFKGNLVVGNKHINVRNIALHNEAIEEHFIACKFNELDLLTLSGEGRTTFSGPMNLRNYTTTLVYDANLQEPQNIIHENELFEDGKRVRKPNNADWVLEGNAKAVYQNNKIIVSSSSNDDITKNHAVLWNTTVFPDNFLLEFEMTAKDAREGLGIIFFASTAQNSREDVFLLHLPKRDGYFGRYMNGELDCYHTSYWASNMEKGSRESTNLRKNKGFKLVALGDENIGRYGHENIGHSEKNLVRLLKIDGKIQLETRGQLVLSWQDDGNSLGKVLGSGQIGLRHMGHAQEVRYSNFKVYKVTKK